MKRGHVEKDGRKEKEEVNTEMEERRVKGRNNTKQRVISTGNIGNKEADLNAVWRGAKSNITFTVFYTPPPPFICTWLAYCENKLI